MRGWSSSCLHLERGGASNASCRSPRGDRGRRERGHVVETGLIGMGRCYARTATHRLDPAGCIGSPGCSHPCSACTPGSRSGRSTRGCSAASSSTWAGPSTGGSTTPTAHSRRTRLPHRRADGSAAWDMTAMRYPGGNFVSGYHWLDGVGPRAAADRPRAGLAEPRDRTSSAPTSSSASAELMDWTPMMTVNLGTGTPKRRGTGSSTATARPARQVRRSARANGSPEPYGVKLWCLGNEMDGPWQLGHVPAEHYAIRAQQAAKMMKDVDTSIETVVCGSCTIGLPTYMEWDRQVLEHIGDFADYISLHRYVRQPRRRHARLPGGRRPSTGRSKRWTRPAATSRPSGAARSGPTSASTSGTSGTRTRQMDGEGKLAPHLIEEVYNLEDALRRRRAS